MSRLREHLRKFFDIYVAVALIVFAARFGVEVTQTLAWPYDIDHFRDMAVTETIARGSWWTDPYYQGEYLWYNPLVPAIAAVAEVATDLPAHVIYARFGAYLNVAAPLAFYWLLRNTLGPLPALASLVVFLFVPPRGAQGWNTPTYSPWLFPMIFAQALYYAALLSLSRLWQRQTTWYRVSAGAL